VTSFFRFTENFQPEASRLKVLVSYVRLEENRKNDVIAELDSLTKPAQIIELDRSLLKRDLHERVADAKNLDPIRLRLDRF
jgi:hypothetical protein